MQSDKEQNRCKAKTRDGTPCKNYPVKGRNRCRMHGGRQPRGNQSPHYQHGMYSRYAGKQLRSLLDELSRQSSEELINPENEIRLMQALIISANALEKELIDLKSLDIISRVIDRLVTAKQRSQSIMIQQQRLIPAQDFERFLSWTGNMLIDEVGQEKAYTIINNMKSFKLDDHETG